MEPYVTLWHVSWDPDSFPSPLLEGDAQLQPGPAAGWDSGQPEDKHTPKVETHVSRAEMQAEGTTDLHFSIEVEGHVISMKPLPLNRHKNIAM